MTWRRTAVAAIAIAATVIQFGLSMRAGAHGLRHRDDRTAAAIDISMARRIPAGATFTATSMAGRYYARYALYPGRPIPIRFAGRSQAAVRAALAAAGVRYVLVTEPDMPAYLRGRASWFTVVAEHGGSPYARLVEIT